MRQIMGSRKKSGESIRNNYGLRIMNYEFEIKSGIPQRLDVFLTKETGLSRSKIKRDILDGNVRVNNEVVKKVSYELRIEETVKIRTTEIKKTSLIPQKGEFKVVFEDEDILVINKDFDMTVHPGIGNHDHTLTNYVYEYLVSFPFLVHRLDKDTSGLIVIAKNEENLLKLQRQWKDRTVKKFYKTLVKGQPDSVEGMIDSPIKRNGKNRQQMTVSIQESAKNAKTHFQVMEMYEDSSLLDVQIFTGRTHQIRVHFQAIGNPVIGDVVYGDKKINKIYKDQYDLERQFLHAYKIEFKHPKTEKSLKLEIPLAKDLQEVIEQLKINNG